ncbi:MAG TPA: 6-phosphofructokinase, partial [Planctomycetota bacterium]|nr:6-phosphofructokinase [Planctomycetota bacterium]
MAEPRKPQTLGIVVGGGPAPGINGVISAATIEAVNNGWRVLGLYDGFKWLASGDTSKTEPLTIEKVSRVHLTGGSILRTSRENPTKEPARLRNVVRALAALEVDALLAIGG